MGPILKAVFLIFSLSILLESAGGANILFYYIIAPYSHRTAIEPLAHKLVEKGHNVTFLTAVKPHKPNPKFHEFLPKSVEKVFNEKLTGIGDDAFPERLQDKYANFMVEVDIITNFQFPGCEAALGSPELGEFFESNRFDLFIMTHAGNKCGYAFAHKMNASVIMMTPCTTFTSEEDTWGFPAESSWHRRYAVRNMMTDVMTFYDKVYNVLNAMLFHFYAHLIVYPRLDGMVREYFKDPHFPSLEDLERENTALFFVNQHFSEDFARSFPPMVVPVGGMHCTDDKNPLPKKLEDFIVGAGDAGFVFVSFGSMVKMSKVPPEFLRMLFDAIKNMKTRFLWRWDTAPPSNLPVNVLADKWFPQQDLLADPRIRGFVSHGGLMSTQQAIYHAVPLLMIPIVFDQPYNAMKVRHHGIGIHLELSEITTANFKDALDTIIHDKSIKENIKMVSKQFRDRPMSPVDTALYWTEYVLRHKDTSSLKPLGIHQTWWERRLLDVWVFLFLVLMATPYIFYKVSFLIIRLCWKSKGPLKQKKN